MIAHLADQITDIGVALAFFYLHKQGTCSEIDAFWFFIWTLFAIIGFRIASTIYVCIELEINILNALFDCHCRLISKIEWKHIILQLLDIEIYYTIYMSIVNKEYQTFTIQERLFL